MLPCQWGVHQELRGNRTRTARQDWRKGCSIPCGVMLNNKNGGVVSSAVEGCCLGSGWAWPASSEHLHCASLAFLIFCCCCYCFPSFSVLLNWLYLNPQVFLLFFFFFFFLFFFFFFSFIYSLSHPNGVRGKGVVNKQLCGALSCLPG